MFDVDVGNVFLDPGTYVQYNTAGLMSILQGDMVVRCGFGDTLRLEAQGGK